MKTLFNNIGIALTDPASKLERATDIRQYNRMNIAREKRYDRERGIPKIYLEEIVDQTLELNKIATSLVSKEEELSKLEKTVRKNARREKKLSKKDLSTPVALANREALSASKFVTMVWMSLCFILAIATETYLNLDMVSGLNLNTSIAWPAAAAITGFLFVLAKVGVSRYEAKSLWNKIGGTIILAFIGLLVMVLADFRYHSHLNLKLVEFQAKDGESQILQLALELLKSPISELAYVLVSLALSFGVVLSYNMVAVRFMDATREWWRLQILAQQAERVELQGKLPKQIEEHAELRRAVEVGKVDFLTVHTKIKQLELARQDSANQPSWSLSNLFASFILIAVIALSGCTNQPPVKVPQTTTLVLVDQSKSMPRMASRQHADTLTAIVERALHNPQDRLETMPIGANTSATAILCHPFELPGYTDKHQSSLFQLLQEDEFKRKCKNTIHAAKDSLKVLLFHPPQKPTEQTDILGTVARLAEFVRNHPGRTYRMVVFTDGEHDTKQFKLKKLESYLEAVNLANQKAKELQQKEGIQADLLKGVVVEFYLIQSPKNQLSYLEAFYKSYYEKFGIHINTTLIPAE